MIRAIPLILILSLFLSGCAQETTAETTTAPIPPAGAVEIGNSAYYSITTQSEQSTQSSMTQTVTATAFVHQIYDPDFDPIATLTTVAAGSIDSQGQCTMTQTSGTLSEVNADDLTLSEHLSGNTGTLILYRSGMSVCHFQYRLHPDGTIEFL